MTPSVSILRVMKDPQLFGTVFEAPSWHAWVLCAAVIFGLTHGLTPDEQSLIGTCLGARTLPTQQVREAWLVCGRRAGKSFFVALVAVYLSCFRTYRLARGERGVFMVLAADRRQARVVMRYVKGFLHSSPLLAQLVTRETQTEVELTNGVTIEIHTVSFRSVRGYTLVGAICDEIAYWPTDESASPDTEVLQALRPAMATVSGALLLCISSPYARRGELWRAYRDQYGKDSERVLVWRADTRTMNPSVPQAFIDQAYVEDAAVAATEYGAQFRVDLETFVSQEAIDGVTVPGRRELPVISQVAYAGFCDPSGGSSDAMTIAIGHPEKNRAVLDVVREVKSRFSPEGVVREFSELLRQYRVTRVCGDRYAGQWPREQFHKCGIRYEASAKPKADLYREFLPAVNSGRVELLDLPRLRSQLGHLERRTARGGRDTIDHPPHEHDDVANAVAGVLVDVLSRAASQVSAHQIMEINRRPQVPYPQRRIF